MADAIHQMLVDLASCALFLLCTGCASLVAVNGYIAALQLLNEFVGFVDTVRHFNKKHPFAVETGGLHIPVGGNNHAVGRRDFHGGQHVLRSAAAIGFGFEGNPQPFACLFQCLGCHVGVSDPGWAGGHSDDTVRALLRRIVCRCGCAVFGRFGPVDDRQKFLRTFCLA